MDVQVSSLSIDQSLDKDGELSSRIDEPELGEEEEEQFYDAGENGPHDSSDVAPSDLNFSATSEDLSADGSSPSEQIAPTLAHQQKCQAEPMLDDPNDISSKAPSSVVGSSSPTNDKAGLVDDNEVPEGSASCTSEHDEEAVSQAATNDPVHQHSDDLGQSKADESGENVPSNEDTAVNVPSHEDTSVNVTNSSKSSMEVMDDESDSHSSKRSSPEKETNSDATEANSSADVETGVGNSAEKDVETISENEAPPESVAIEKDEAVAETNEILTMDDSDVDESLQENLDVAIKVVEESQSSPRPVTTEAAAVAQTEDGTNDENVSEHIISKSESILEEFREDAAKIDDGDSSELLDSRLCPCQVVLFRIDFDENALKYLKQKTEPLQLSGDCKALSNSDTLFSETTIGDSTLLSKSSNRNSDDLSVKAENLSSPKRRVLTKAARKMIPSPKSVRKPISPRARNARTASTNSESTRPRRNTRNATAQDTSFTYADSLNSDDEAPVISPSGKRKAVVSSPRRPVRSAKQLPHPKRISSRRNGSAVAENLEKELTVGISAENTLKCVSIPVITDIINLLKEKSCSELIALIDEKEDKLPSHLTKSKLNKNTTAKGRSRRSKLSPSDTSKSSVEDDDYKTYGKMWKYDVGTSRNENNFSLRSETNSKSNKRSSRQSVKVRNYAEDSRSDDECPSKKAKTSGRNSSRVERNEKQDTNSGSEKAGESPKAKSTANKRASRTSAKVQNYVEVSKSDDESTVKRKRTSRQNSTHAESNKKYNTESDEEKTEDSPKMKSTSNKRSSRKNAEVQNCVEDSESNDHSPFKKVKTSKENLIDAERSEQDDIDSDEKKADELPKAKSTPNKRSSRKKAKVQYVKDSESDDESPLTEKKASSRKLRHKEHDEKNDSDSDEERTEDSPKVKTSNKRSGRTRGKVANYNENSESDEESPLKKETRKKKLTDVKGSEKNDTDSDDENVEDSPGVNSSTNKRSSGKNAKVQKYAEDSESNDKSPLEEETSQENLTNTECKENDSDNNDEKLDNSPITESTSNNKSFRKSAKVLKYVEDSESNDKSSLEEETSSKNLTEEESGEKNGINSDDEKSEDSLNANSRANKRSFREGAKVQKYVDGSESDDEITLKKAKLS